MTPVAFKSLTDPEQRIEWLVENAADLPSQARIAMAVTKLVNQNSASAAQVAKTISGDQVLTARVLKMANSAFYGAPRRISTLTDAIVLLGMRAIRDMAMSVSCQDLLDREVHGYSIRRGDLWKHSSCVGFAAQQLARRAKYSVAEEAFVAGLLHDIGKVIISHRLSDEFVEITRRSEEQGVAYYDAERMVLGFDHAEIGARMCERWNLPPQLVTTIRYHHNPSAQPDSPPLTRIVHLADVLCMMLGIGLGGDGLRYKLEDGVVASLGLDDEAIEQVLSMVIEYAAMDVEQDTTAPRR
ncbi:MAG: HDOD domain-containing protein [Capsulimonadaceae bacterium]|nr:HDOD domain-containing protein [Capsulimonadaceae bacterium]